MLVQLFNGAPRPQQRHDLGLVTRQEVKHGGLGSWKAAIFSRVTPGVNGSLGADDLPLGWRYPMAREHVIVPPQVAGFFGGPIYAGLDTDVQRADVVVANLAALAPA
jgi:hypothetical protein